MNVYYSAVFFNYLANYIYKVQNIFKIKELQVCRGDKYYYSPNGWTIIKQTETRDKAGRQCMYNVIQVCSCKNCWHGKAKCITYSENASVSAALVTQHAKRMCCTLLLSVGSLVLM